VVCRTRTPYQRTCTRIRLRSITGTLGPGRTVIGSAGAEFEQGLSIALAELTEELCQLTFVTVVEFLPVKSLVIKFSVRLGETDLHLI